MIKGLKSLNLEISRPILIVAGLLFLWSCHSPQSNNKFRAEIDSINNLSLNYINQNKDSFEILNERGLELSEENNYEIGTIRALKNRALYFKEIAQLDSAKQLTYYLIPKALTLNDSFSLAPLYQLAGYLAERENLADSVNYYYSKSLQLYEGLNDSLSIVSLYSDFYTFYRKSGLKQESSRVIDKIYQFIPKSENVKKILLYQILGAIYFKDKNYDSAYYYFYNSKFINSDGNKINIAQSLNNAGSAALLLGIYDCAISHFSESAHLFDQLGNFNAVASIYKNIGITYYNLEASSKTILPYFDSSIYYSHLVNNYDNIAFIYNKIAELYEEENRLDSSLYYSKLSLLYKDSANISSKQDMILSFNQRYQNEKQKGIIQKQKAEIKYKDKQQQNLFLIILLIIVTALSIYLLIIYRNKKREQAFKFEMDELINDSETKVLSAMLEGQGKERKRLSEELHDQLGNTLATAKMHLSVLDTNDRTKKLMELLDQSISELRQISHGLAANEQKGFELEAAVRLLCENLNEKQIIQIHFNSSGEKFRLDLLTEMDLLRVIQELISNILKHSEASEVNINFNYIDNLLSIMVEDNGIGFNIDQVESGIGLKNISERCKRINADLQFDTGQGNGTTVIIEIEND